MPELYDSIRGCLWGGAAGDALGYAVEFMDWKWIRQRWGASGIREYSLSKGGLAEVSDDTQMTLFTVLGMTNIAGSARFALSAPSPGSSVDSMHWAYLNWYRTQTEKRDPERTWGDWLTERAELWKWQAPGNTCLSALESGRCGTMDRPINHSCGCGGVMRTAPCAFAPRGMAGPDVSDADTAIVLGAQAAAVTHCHPMGWIPAGILSDMIYRMVYLGDTGVESAAGNALAHAKLLWGEEEGMFRLERLFEAALEKAKGPLPDEEAISSLDPAWKGSGGWKGDDALAIALLCAARYPDDFEACIRAAVNHGGDSDSTGAIAGNLIGARLGIGAVGERWMKPIDVAECLEEACERLYGIARA